VLRPYSLSVLSDMPIGDLLFTFENCLLLGKHSTMSDEFHSLTPKPFINLKLAMKYDTTASFNMASLDLERMARCLQGRSKEHKIGSLFNFMGQLQANPMDLKVDLLVRDLMIRGQPLLSQKMDGSI